MPSEQSREIAPGHNRDAHPLEAFSHSGLRLASRFRRRCNCVQFGLTACPSRAPSNLWDATAATHKSQLATTAITSSSLTHSRRLWHETVTPCCTYKSPSFRFAGPGVQIGFRATTCTRSHVTGGGALLSSAAVVCYYCGPRECVLYNLTGRP